MHGGECVDRVILHSDLNNFYASVECMLHPELKGKCVAVCGSEENRHGIVLAKSEEAKALGVKTAETIWQARAKCPELVIVSPHFEEYSKYSKLVMGIYEKYTDLIEPFGLDECWLDVTASQMLFGDGYTIADKIRKEVKETLGLTVSVGVSFNKVFAKLGSDMKKPDAVTEIKREDFKEKIWALPSNSIIGVGRSTFAKLNELGIKTIGDIANMPPEFFESRFGKHGLYLWQNANGLDTSEVTHKDYRAPAKSVGHGMTLKADLVNDEEVWRVIYHLAHEVERELIKDGCKADRVSVSIKTNDLAVKEHQVSLENPTASAYEIANKLFCVFKKNFVWTKNIRAVTVRAVRLVQGDEGEQMSLFDKSDQKKEKLQKTAFELESKFGVGAVTFGSLMNNEKIPTEE